MLSKWGLCWPHSIQERSWTWGHHWSSPWVWKQRTCPSSPSGHRYWATRDSKLPHFPIEGEEDEHLWKKARCGQGGWEHLRRPELKTGVRKRKAGKLWPQRQSKKLGMVRCDWKAKGSSRTVSEELGQTSWWSEGEAGHPPREGRKWDGGRHTKSLNGRPIETLRPWVLGVRENQSNARTGTGQEWREEGGAWTDGQGTTGLGVHMGRKRTPVPRSGWCFGRVGKSQAQRRYSVNHDSLYIRFLMFSGLINIFPEEESLNPDTDTSWWFKPPTGLQLQASWAELSYLNSYNRGRVGCWWWTLLGPT